MAIRLSVCLTTVMLLLVTGATVRTEESGAHGPYSVVRVGLTSRADISRIASLGIDVEGSTRASRTFIDLTVDQREIAKLEQAGFAIQTIVPDWRAAYVSRLQSDRAASAAKSRARGFHLGSMGGFLTLREVEAQLDSMRLLYPKLVGPRDSIGQTYEGRTLWGVRISATETSVPCVLFTALHHAREPQGLMTVMYFLWYILEQYGVRDDITALLNTREIYVVPVVNPDGYAYNITTSSAGGGLWRKNRRPNEDGSYGVDLNRNYGFKWGVDEIGSSAFAADDTYRGPAAFSEPEIQAIRDLCIKKKPVSALNYHSYGNDVVYPWGYSDQVTPYSLLYKRLAEYLTLHNYYIYGTNGVTVGYLTNGDSDDWMYGDTDAKPRAIALTPEVGGVDDGFWPLPSRITPLADANLEANILFAQCGGPHYVIAGDLPDPVFTNGIAAFDLRLVNIGVGVGPHSATLSFKGNGVEVLAPQHPTVTLGESTAVQLTLKRSQSAMSGQKAVIRVLCECAGGRSEDSVSFLLGQPVVLFADSANRTSTLWAAKGVGSLVTWGYTTREAYEGTGSYASSPWGQYPKNYSGTYILQRALPLVGAAAQLRFVSRWDIEPEYDLCLVEVSTDSGLTWSSLPGRYTRPASGANGGKQTLGLWGYDRTMSRWVEERIDLAPALGARAMLRFRFESDSYVQGDGFFADLIQVLLYPQEIANHVAMALPERTSLEQNYPNPFNPVTQIRFTLGVRGDSHQAIGNRRVRLVVYDMLGREVAVLVDEQKVPGNYEVTWDASRMASGVYYYGLEVDEFRETKTMVLVK